VRRLTVLAAILAAIVVACGSSTLPTPLPTLPPDTPEPTSTSLIGTPAPDGQCVLPPLRYRAAQVLLAAVPGTEPDEANAEIVRKGIGGVLLFGPNLVDADQVRALTNGLQAEAEVPLAIAVDEEGGRVARLAAAGILPESPTARALGKLKAAAVREAARTIGDGLFDLGITVDLAPVLDVTGEAADGVIGDRSFGSSPKAVARSGVAVVQGLLDAGVAPVGKHFPGHGETTVDSHTGLPVVATSLADLEAGAFVPFRAAIEAGIPAIMLGHLLVRSIDKARPASLSSPVVTLLREDLAFDGLVMTDDLYMDAITAKWDVPVAAELALKAGADMVVLAGWDRIDDVLDRLVGGVKTGRLSEERLDDAFLHVERFKGVTRWDACGG
jgi:beta-N-acetylhexosaminidase